MAKYTVAKNSERKYIKRCLYDIICYSIALYVCLNFLSIENNTIFQFIFQFFFRKSCLSCKHLHINSLQGNNIRHAIIVVCFLFSQKKDFQLLRLKKQFLVNISFINLHLTQPILKIPNSAASVFIPQILITNFVKS